MKTLFGESLGNDAFLNQLSVRKNDGQGNKYLARISFLPSSFANNNIVIVFIKFLFPFIYALVITGLLIKLLLKKVCKKRKSVPDGAVFLLMSGALPRVAKRAGLNSNSNVWLVLDGSTTEEISGRCINDFEIIGYKDLFKAFFLSWVSLVDAYNFSNGECLLLALNSFRWYVYRYAAIRIPIDTELYFCNHKDRWAFLADSLPHKKKNLIQHGTEICVQNKAGIAEPFLYYKENLNAWVMRMPVRYKSLSKVYSFSEREAEAMSFSILDCKPLFEYTGYGLNLTHIESDRFKVLIVAYQKLYFSREVELLSCLATLDIDVFLKNHPTQPCGPYEDLLGKYEFKFINEPIFPEVDLVLSYDSTLALEYQSIGAEVIYHTDYSNKQIVEMIKNKINCDKIACR